MVNRILPRRPSERITSQPVCRDRIRSRKVTPMTESSLLRRICWWISSTASKKVNAGRWGRSEVKAMYTSAKAIILLKRLI
ncbi:hypothetical protein D3C75_1251510 [compost metagenome]